jgi:hypothetical protein
MVPGRAPQIVEGRFVGSLPDDFFPIERLFGTLEEAQASAANFLANHRMSGTLVWREGAPDCNGPAFYAHATEITFRIRAS